MVDFDKRHQVFVAMAKRINSHKLLCDFWKFFGIEVVRDEVTGARAVDEESHRALCRASTMINLSVVTEDNAVAWMFRNPAGLHDWVADEAEREGILVQEWFVERGLADEFEDLIRYGMMDDNVPPTKAQQVIGLAIADEFLWIYQSEARREGIYNDD